MTAAFLSIGSNIEPQKNIPLCLDLLRTRFRVLKESSIYETAPVGSAGMENFWNLAAKIEMELSREELIKKIRSIESALGRTRDPQNKFAPRTIDIDLLPETGFAELPFVMIPLAEIAPEQYDPDSGKLYREIAERHLNQGYLFRKLEKISGEI